MFTLKVIFVILLMIPLLILAFILLHRLFDSALKYKEKPAVNQARKKRQRRR